MGIRNLHTFLRKTIPLVYEEVSLTKYAYKRIAIDLSIYLCKYKAFYKERWLDAFLGLVTCLRENEIHFIFILDSKSPPEKEEEKKNRILQRQKLKTRIDDLESSLKLFLDKNQISEPIQKWIDNKSNMLNIVQVSNEIERLKSNFLDIRVEDFILVKQLFDILEIPYCYAVSEAEATCAHLCLNGQVDAVMTEDTDILAYGCPFNLHKINIQTNTITLIEMKKLLTELQMTYPQFRDFCIMCGTDYNTNVPKIGPERAYKYLKDYKSIDHLSTFLDVSILKHKTVRHLFSNDINFNISDDVYCGIPKYNEMNLFYFTNNCHFDLPRLFNAFNNPSVPLLFTDDDDNTTANSLLGVST